MRVALQPDYINQSDWIAYRDRRVRAVAQYKLVDEAALSSFQTGLRFSTAAPSRPTTPTGCRSGSAGRGSRLRVYGQVRPAAGLDRRRSVQIQDRPPSGGAFATVKTVTVRSRRGAVPGRACRSGPACGA